MSDDPFRPPRANVGTGAPPAPREPRPWLITLACRLLWVEIAIGILSLHPAIRGEWWIDPDQPELPPDALLVAALIVAAISVGLCAFLLWQAGRGHNWARWTLAAYLACTWLISLPVLDGTFARAPLAGLIDTLSIGNELFVCYALLFSRAARWFQGGPRPR